MDNKRIKEKNMKMNDEEYAINQDILEKIRYINNDFGRSTSFTEKFK